MISQIFKDMLNEQLIETEDEEILELNVTPQLRIFASLIKGIIARFIKDIILQEAATYEIGESKFCMINRALLNVLQALAHLPEDEIAEPDKPQTIITGLDKYINKLSKLAYKCWLEETIERAIK